MYPKFYSVSAIANRCGLHVTIIHHLTSELFEITTI